MSERVRGIYIEKDSIVLPAAHFDLAVAAVAENERLLDEVTQLRGNLSLAEEGLANYAQENERLRALLTQAPIAKVTVREGCMANAPDDVYVKIYAPGLPPGEYDLYLMPDVPQSAEHKLNTPKIVDTR